MSAGRLIEVADAKTWLGIALSDTTRDDLIESLVDAASAAAIGVMGQDPTRRSRNVVADGYGGKTLPLNFFPITAVASVTIDPDCGGLPLPATDYTFDDNAIYLRCGRFPVGKRRVAVSYTAGLATIPPDIALAVKFIVKAMWDARLTDMNSTGESFNGVGGASFWPSGPGAVPPQAMQHLMRHFNPLRV